MVCPQIITPVPYISQNTAFLSTKDPAAPSVRLYCPLLSCKLAAQRHETIRIVAHNNRELVRNAGVGRHAFGNMSAGISSKVKTSKPAEQDLSLAIPHLKSRWMQLPGADRARAVAAIRRTGVSIRQIARDLGVSESNLRHLLKTLNASTDDQDLARQGKISTNELVRRGQTAKARPEEPPPEVVKTQRAVSDREGADLICNWILQEDTYRLNRKLIIEGVTDKLGRFQWAGWRPPVFKRRGLTHAQIIELSRPVDKTMRDLPIEAFYEKWLLIWACAAIPDFEVRDAALKQALKRLSGN